MQQEKAYLPDKVFLDRMKELLKDEYEDYLKSLSTAHLRAFRVNYLKTNEEEIETIFNGDLKHTPFADNNFYLKDLPAFGNTPMHVSGMLYMQEPSASSAVTVLNPKPGMYILDMCAAPGSKSTQIAEKMDHKGVLIANEINARRCQILKENLERHGAANTIVINSDPKEVAESFPNYFDAVLCDAPCSGEGMFRKNDLAISEWSLSNVELCAKRQKTILESAYKCLKPGGVLVYSTCTFAPEENELNMKWFTDNYTDMHIVSTGADFGRNGFDFGNNTIDSVRIFPMDEGEGHYICKLRKDNAEYNSDTLSLLKSDKISSEIIKQINGIISRPYPYYFMKNNRIYGGVIPFFSTGNCRLIRHQVLLGEVNKDRFEPSHGLFLSAYSPARNAIELTDEEYYEFIKGMTIKRKKLKGYYAVNWHNHTVGFVKGDGTTLKNKYPKEYRVR